MNRNAVGIDLGATVHFVAVPPGRDPATHVRCFETFTADLQASADWLEQCGIETVDMESTGIYWIPLYDLLEQRGFEVLLINPCDVKKFRRKTDVSDCQWLQILHTFGLLRGSFRPHERIVTLRSYLRHRDNLVKCATDEVRRIRAKKGGAQAVTAVARKLAIIVYHMLKEGRPYTDQGAAYYEARYRERLVEGLASLGEAVGAGRRFRRHGSLIRRAGSRTVQI